MSFDLQPHLVGELVEVRPLREADFEALASAAADPLIWEQHPDDRHLPDVFHDFFLQHLETGGALLVTDRATGEVIGTSRFHGYSPSESSVEIGWTFLVRSRWGGDDNRDLKRVMLRHAFQYVDTVLFFVHPNNLRSQRALEKIGAARQAPRPNGKGSTREVFSIRREHFARQGP